MLHHIARALKLDTKKMVTSSGFYVSVTNSTSIVIAQHHPFPSLSPRSGPVQLYHARTACLSVVHRSLRTLCLHDMDTWSGYQFVTKSELLIGMSGMCYQMSCRPFRTLFDHGGYICKLVWVYIGLCRFTLVAQTHVRNPCLLVVAHAEFLRF